jgi:branched-chain amino acid transport system substrate-binding protein
VKSPLPLAAALLLAVLAAAPPVAAAPSRAPLVLAGTISRTGKFVETGRELERGYQVFVDRANAAGGILGRPVRLALEDDRSDARRARELYGRILRERKGDLLLAPYSSEITLAVADLIEANRFPVVAAGASSSSIWATPRKYLVGLYPPSDRQMDGFLEMAAVSGVRNVAILGFADPYSSTAAEGARRAAGEMSLPVVRFRILPSRTAPSLEAEGAAIAAAAPDAVVVCGYLSDAMAARLATKKAGLSPRAFAATVGPAYTDFRNLLGPLAEGMFGPSEWEPASAAGTESKGFLAAYRARFHEDPSFQAALGYAAGQILKAAAEEEGSLDPERLLASIRGGRHATIVGVHRLRPDGARAGGSQMVVQWQSHRKEVVWPAAYRTKAPVL